MKTHLLLLAFCIAALFVTHSPAKSPKVTLYAEGGLTHFAVELRMRNSVGFGGGMLLRLSEKFAVGVEIQRYRADRPFEVIGGEQAFPLTVSRLMIAGNMQITSPGSLFELAIRGGFGKLNFHRDGQEISLGALGSIELAEKSNAYPAVDIGPKFLFSIHRRSSFYVSPVIEGFWDKKMKYNLIFRGGVNVALF